MLLDAFNNQLLEFIQRSPTPFHAVASLRQMLEDAGFEVLDERANWQLRPGGRYLVTRNDSSIIALVMPANGELLQQGLRMVGAHTDSPCLKVKPNPVKVEKGYLQLGVEVYGGALLNPWFDRDLSLAGRVNFLQDGQLRQALVDFQHPLGTIPSLAIHLDREANSNRSVNPQQDLPVVMMRTAEKEVDFNAMLLAELSREGIAADKVLDYELLFYDTQAPAKIGLQQDFIAAARLDNLLSCFVGLRSLLDADQQRGALLVCNDHEEVGSVSAAGADGPFLQSLLERLAPNPEDRARMLAHSMMISADNAHGVHPNFTDRHDGNHGPLLNEGPVIKINANQRYATNSETSALFRHLAELENVPVQAFTVRSDMACGSTIGPITAAKIGVPTLDIGVPTFGMHSIRELAGREDAFHLYKVLKRYQSASS